MENPLLKEGKPTTILYRNHQIQKKVKVPVSALLVNKRGSYFSTSSTTLSKWEGLICCLQQKGSWEYFKTINAIKHNQKILTYEYSPTEVIRKGKGNERFLLCRDHNVLLYSANGLREATMELDCRKLYDFHTWGREYRIFEQEDCTVVEYTKKGEEEYTFYLVIYGTSTTQLNNWKEQEYAFDKYRGSKPDKLWILEALKLKLDPKGTTVAIGFGPQLNATIATTKYAHKQSNQLRNEALQKKQVVQHNFMLPIEDKTTKTAYLACVDGLDALTVDTLNEHTGIYAGLWWFHQWWSRDEHISLGAYIIKPYLKLVKQILQRNLSSILQDGRLANRFPASELGSADGIGWMFKRWEDVLNYTEKHFLTERLFSADELTHLEHALHYAIHHIKEQYEKGGLITNKRLETWMDTTPIDDQDVREGACIEIQAQFLAMLSLEQKVLGLINRQLIRNNVSNDYAKNLEKIAYFKHLEDEMKQKVRHKFWNGFYLADKSDDHTVRPNVFLAHYCYEELLSQQEWKDCFSLVVPKLWSNWKNKGGLTTIDKEHPLFHTEYSGEQPNSYHRGDVWYFVNNIAAIALYKVDKNAFKDYIQGILNASTQTTLWQGIIGHQAELSSAKQQEANGSLSQAWSMSTYIELLRCIHQSS